MHPVMFLKAVNWIYEFQHLCASIQVTRTLLHERLLKMVISATQIDEKAEIRDVYRAKLDHPQGPEGGGLIPVQLLELCCGC
jgi:hypothetical protein